MGRRAGNRNGEESAFSRAVAAVFAFVKFAEFEILFILFFIVAFVIFKELMARPEYNQILVKKPGGIDLWPY
ncbi:GRIP and coiled-coil domain-containing protein [Melia azedarach]|uniref:GRIP and coiled-coil domain-containing protein n=1 Tax=Melia azedarach TaxID=155640 RepID=A0ACC1X2J4_MELAZ|nr:GRIP and coiled-coil domain-containing protein [Melia azedarach]